MSEHEHARDLELPHHHLRSSDRFPVVYLRKGAYILLAGLLPTVGVLWRDREAKIATLNANTAGLYLVNVRVDNLEKRVNEFQASNMNGQENIQGDIRALRDEVRQMYLRAIKSGGSP